MYLDSLAWPPEVQRLADVYGRPAVWQAICDWFVEGGEIAYPPDLQLTGRQLARLAHVLGSSFLSNRG
jgi:hypothetical protein